jgi:hypothetical protein
MLAVAGSVVAGTAVVPLVGLWRGTVDVDSGSMGKRGWQATGAIARAVIRANIEAMRLANGLILLPLIRPNPGDNIEAGNG